MKRRRPISQKALNILKAIRDFQNEHGYTPTYREIGRRTGIAAVSNVAYWIDVLDQRGYATLEHYVDRGVKINDAGLDLLLDYEI